MNTPFLPAPVPLPLSGAVFLFTVVFLRKGESQMVSNNLISIEQHELPLARKPESVRVSIEVIRAQRTAAAALSLAQQASGLEDKGIYLPLKIDAASFSKMKKGKDENGKVYNFPVDKVADLCRLVGNTIYPEWIAYQIGGTIMLIESEAERMLRTANDENQKLQERLEYLENLTMGRRAAR